MAKRVLELHAEKMVYGGYALARKDGKIFFIQGAHAGEDVRVKIERQKGNTIFCSLLKVVSASPFRISPMCEHHIACGGCDWMGVAYEKQLEYKRHIFSEQMRRIAKHELSEVEIVPTLEYHYRNKVTYRISGKKLGFLKKKSHEYVNVKTCAIAAKSLNVLKLEVERGLSKYPEISSKIRKIVLRTNGTSKTLVFFSNEKVKLSQFSNAENIVVVSENFTDVVVGSGTLNFTFGGIVYRVPALSFFQVNTVGAEALSSTVKEWAFEGHKALDLYCGVGLFALQIAENFQHVTGVESSIASVKAARMNAIFNGKSNVEFESQPVEKYHFSESYDTIIADPPREGLKKSVVEKIISLKPKRLVYVSCDSSTFARDAKKLLENGFYLEKVKLIDMFPQTHHFETIGLFKAKCS